MDVRAALTAFDEQLRRNPPPESPTATVEREPTVVRVLDPEGWSGVLWSALTPATADAAIARELTRFRTADWEWKHYSYDHPADLPARLTAAGFTPEPPETVLLAEISDLDTTPRLPPGITLRRVTTQADLAAFTALHESVFGTRAPRLATKLRETPDSLAVILAVDETGTPVAEARAEFPPGTDFAGLWGGATLPAYRGRGIFRALVAHRAALAAARGIRYLQVDALPTSRPILERLGFTPVAATTPYIPPRGIDFRT